MKAWIRAYNVAWCQMLYENQEALNQPVGDYTGGLWGLETPPQIYQKS